MKPMDDLGKPWKISFARRTDGTWELVRDLDPKQREDQEFLQGFKVAFPGAKPRPVTAEEASELGVRRVLSKTSNPLYIVKASRS
jgi:hypothetical protein